MTKADVYKIFGAIDVIRVGQCTVTVDDFLHVAGFSAAPDNPTKQELHDIDGGVKGYAELIESGNYD
jgi:hypothetical protein